MIRAFIIHGRMAKLVDALVSGTSARKSLRVRVSLRPPAFAKATAGLRQQVDFAKIELNEIAF